MTYFLTIDHLIAVDAKDIDVKEATVIVALGGLGKGKAVLLGEH